MKSSKWFFLLFIVFLLMSCSSQQIETSQPTANPSTPFLDFDHPRLHEIAGNKPLVIREVTRTRRTEDIAYAAIIIDIGADSLLEEKMLLFRLEKTGPVLLYESDPYGYMTFNVLSDDPLWLIDNGHYYYYRNVVGGIYPIDENYLIVPFTVSNGGNCYDCTGMKIVGIPQNGNVKDITPTYNFTSKTFIDISGNLEFRIIATRYYEWDYGAKSHVGSPYAFRLYAWNGSAYVDVSKDEKDFFDKQTSGFVREIKSTYGKTFTSDPIMPLLSQIFFNYESSGRVEYGWEQIQTLGDLSHWDIQNTPPEEIQTYHDVFSQLEQRKNEDLSTTTP